MLHRDVWAACVQAIHLSNCRAACSVGNQNLRVCKPCLSGGCQIAGQYQCLAPPSSTGPVQPVYAMLSFFKVCDASVNTLRCCVGSLQTQQSGGTLGLQALSWTSQTQRMEQALKAAARMTPGR